MKGGVGMEKDTKKSQDLVEQDNIQEQEVDSKQEAIEEDNDSKQEPKEGDNDSKEESLEEDSDSNQELEDENSDLNKITEDENQDDLNEEPSSNIDLPVPVTKANNSLATDRHTQLQQEIDTARAIVQKADQEVEEMIANIQKDLNDLEEHKDAKLTPIIKESDRILRALDIEPTLEDSNLQVELKDPKDEPLIIKNLSTGKGSGWIWGLFASILTLIAWYIYGAMNLGLPLIPKQIKDLSFLKPITEKISLFIDQAPNSATGEGIAIITALAVGFIVYSIIRAMRLAKNQHIVEETTRKATQYFQKKEEEKKSLVQIDEQIKTLREFIENSEVLLDEKNAILRRAIFIEKVNMAQELHPKTHKELEILQDILESLDRLSSVPVAEEGKMNEEWLEILQEFKEVINKEIERLYS